MAGPVPARRERSIPAVLMVGQLLILGLTPAGAIAQTLPATRVWDAAIAGGVFLGHPEATELARYHDSWYETGQLALMVGRYWSRHVKTEVELAMTGEGRQFVEQYVRVPSSLYPVPYGSERLFQINEISVGFAWQFFENQWVHPYLTGAVAIDVDRVRRHTWEQAIYTGDPRQPGTRVLVSEEHTNSETRHAARAVLGGGAKVYVAPRWFLRAEARGGFGRRIENLVFRAGIGVDF